MSDCRGIAVRERPWRRVWGLAFTPEAAFAPTVSLSRARMSAGCIAFCTFSCSHSVAGFFSIALAAEERASNVAAAKNSPDVLLLIRAGIRRMPVCDPGLLDGDSISEKS